MKIELVDCPKCNARVRKDRIEKHLRKVHGLSSEQRSEIHSKPTTKTGSRWTTDDSGVVITIEQWAKLHGEINTRDRLDKRLANVSLKKKPRKRASNFERIDDIPNRKVVPPNSRTRKKDKNTPRRALKKCEYCSASVRVDRMKKHLQKVHGVSSQAPKKLQGGKNKYHKANSSKHDHPYLAPEGQDGNIAAAFYDAFRESQDGSKGLGHMRRGANGQFGSYPLHDNYDDESWA